jgi:AAA15 family ATPase/GTPase
VLYSLEIENFYSIRDRQVVNLLAAETAPADPERLVPIWPGSDERVPKVIALFGPNASGKSNVLRALSFLGWFARDSFIHGPDAVLPYQSFKSPESQKQPTKLSVQFAGPVDLSRVGETGVPPCKYSYEVEFGSAKGKSQQVLSETLRYWPVRNPVVLFKRDSTGSVKANKAFGLSGFQSALENVLRPNASVISTLMQLKHPIAEVLWRAASSIISNIVIEKHEFSDDYIAQFYENSPDFVQALNEQIERIDFGISAMELQKGPAGMARAVFHHAGLSEPLALQFESHGTRQFIKTFPLIFQALKLGGIAVVDELDISIHPLVLPEVLRWFYDPHRNPHNAQLWITVQNASLLEVLIKEEVLFCEKDLSGCTSIYGLRDVNDVRRNDNYYKKYLSGVYGALPQLG